MKQEILHNGKRIILIGTAHISQNSIEEVETIIDEEKPDTVCVELCQSRYSSIQQEDRWKNMDIVKVIKEGKASLLLANLLLSSFQKKMGDQLGVKPGSEMIAAVKKAEEFNTELVLADREVSITLKRTWRNLTGFEKAKLLNQLLNSFFVKVQINEEELEKLKEKDILTNLIEQMGIEFPKIKQVLVDERDQYLAKKIADAPGKTIVAVVGAGHCPGIIQYLEKEIDLKTLETIPPKKKIGKILKWVIPILIISAISYGFYASSSSISIEMIKRWVLANGVLAALGALLAGGHVFTIIVAFIAAPITSLNPTIGAGYVAGLAEAWIRKPKVHDFENLSQDIGNIKRFRKNQITRILLVLFLSSLGSSIGTFIGIPLIASLL